MKKRKGFYTIGMVARMYNIHPQTLRLYEREGLLKPQRTAGNNRLYTDEDLERLEFILTLTREFGVNLAGVDIILRMKEQMEEMEQQIQQLLELVQQLLQKIPQEERGLMQLPKEVTVVKITEILKKKDTDEV
ncbi:MAG: helix-turn-helix transcriptional regulator [Aquificae bacterium]|jgi:MerR family transcriptional regulator/heat shock protein HspR|nr:helix-turn-helix transcriptional regulator [Aquificota bacterium]